MTVGSVPRHDQSAAAVELSFSRAEWMTLLAESPVTEIESHWRALPHPPFQWIRRPEYGSAMIRGRASGTGAQFNLGDVTVTRCTVQIGTGEIGISYVMGRNKRHAALAALFDAMLQHEKTTGQDVVAHCIASLAEGKRRRHQDIVRETRSSKVEFTMLSRGGDDQ
ncbi:phosphonate C-P lyase system protein PhnG [Microvirga sp. VF16]|uniref:phosphonate C-P lyase system protein PhnG n=1 Tax=Microvirga sp. VF16 TaxID=2807101 RepID=UPI00193DA76F|nr:phosphonate C-P lyase system protein PhnG [Microvirga sp. VF16]QRM32360.1 phosphonate C-P lyase system protein PhnG [Microvirga sp. VF16]